MLRRVMVLVGVLVVALGVVPAASPAGAGLAPEEPGATLLPAFYGSNLSPVSVAVCLDDEVVVGEVTSGTFLKLDPGTYRIRMGLSAEPVVCDDLDFVDEIISVLPYDLVVGFNGANEVGGAAPELRVASFVDCLDPDSADGLLTVFNGANAFTLDATFRGEDVAVDLANGEVTSSLQLTGTDELEAFPAGTSFTAAADVDLEAGQRTLAVVVGGNGPDLEDRTFGIVSQVVPAEVCELPPPGPGTTQAPPTSASTAAPAAQAAPRFTG